MTRALRCEACGQFVAPRKLAPNRAEIPVCRDCADGLDYRERCAHEDAIEDAADRRRDR